MRSRRTNRMRLPNTASDDDGTVAFKSYQSHFACKIEKGYPKWIPFFDGAPDRT